MISNKRQVTSDRKNKKYLSLIPYRFSLSCGFTLIELLVVISIIGILISLTLLGLQGGRESARNARRKSDIEEIRAGLELYKADCKTYPLSDIFASSSLTGDDSIASCASTNTYISQVPQDPFAPARIYRYASDGVTYEICASLENGTGTVTCGGFSTCGSGNSCNYKAVSP